MSEQRVVNTSPLIYLSRAGLLQLLETKAGHVIVPQAVADEIRAWPKADAAQHALNNMTWLKIMPDELISTEVAAWDLGRGESSVIACGLKNPGHVLVIDDLAARRCAAALGLAVRGTAGLVLDARKTGSIQSARQTFMILRDAGMYLSDAVIESVLRLVNE